MNDGPDIVDYLVDEVLWLLLLEPLIIRHRRRQDWPGPAFNRESFEENLQLAKL